MSILIRGWKENIKEDKKAGPVKCLLVNRRYISLMLGMMDVLYFIIEDKKDIGFSIWHSLKSCFNAVV